MPEEPCVFCQIVQENPPGEVNLQNVFLSTESVVGFLDIQPLISSKAHVLVIPRQHYSTLDKVDQHTAAELGKALVVVSRAIQIASCSEDDESFAFNVIQNNGIRAGQVVHHVHFHLILRSGESSSSWFSNVKTDSNDYSRTKMQFQKQFYGKLPREDLDDERLQLALILREKLQQQSSKL